MRILVLRGGALGDFIVTLPALGLLRARWPDARIELAGNATAAQLGMIGRPPPGDATSRGLRRPGEGGSSRYLDAVHSQHERRWSALYGDKSLAPEFAAWLADFDLVINFWPDPDGNLARRFPSAPGQQFITAAAQPGLAPAARHFCEALRALGLSTVDFHSHLEVERVIPNAPRRAKDNPPYPIAIHPGSGSPRKNWPDARWLDLIRRLDEPVLLVLGEAEGGWSALTSTRFERLGGKTLRLAENLPLPELAAALAGCRVFVGHDSGVSHLAAAVGAPCVLLFGPTDPAMWAPPGDHVRVVRRGESLEAITVADVVAALPA